MTNSFISPPLERNHILEVPYVKVIRDTGSCVFV